MAGTNLSVFVSDGLEAPPILSSTLMKVSLELVRIARLFVATLISLLREPLSPEGR